MFELINFSVFCSWCVFVRFYDVFCCVVYVQQHAKATETTTSEKTETAPETQTQNPPTTDAKAKKHCMLDEMFVFDGYAVTDVF